MERNNNEDFFYKMVMNEVKLIKENKKLKDNIDLVIKDLTATLEANPKHNNGKCISFDVDHIAYLIYVLKGDNNE